MRPGSTVKRWSPDDIKFLSGQYLNKTDAEIAAELHRSEEAVQTKRMELQLIKPTSFSEERSKKTQFQAGHVPSPNARRGDGWSAQEDEYLKANYKRMTARTIGEHVGRTVMAVQSRADLLGLAKRLRMPVGYTQHKWTQEELEFIKANFQDYTCDELADQLNVTTNSLRNQVKKLKLTKTPESLKKIYARVDNSGQFKAGELPLNTLADQEITVRTQYSTGIQTKFIRLSLNKWLPLHQYNWSKAGNDVPAGYVLRFIDGDRMNCDVSNLHLIQRGPHSRDEAAKAARVAKKQQETDERRQAKLDAKEKKREAGELRKLQHKLDRLKVQMDKLAERDKANKAKEANRLAREQQRLNERMAAQVAKNEAKQARRLADQAAAAQSKQNIAEERKQRRAAKRLAESVAKAEAQAAVLLERQAEKQRKADERRQQVDARRAARASSKPAMQARKRKALAKLSPEDQEAERRKTALIRAEQKRQAKAAKEKKRIEREEESNRKMATRVIDHKQLVPVYIDRATTIYIKAGQDPDQARKRFLDKRAASLSNLKHASA